MSLTVSTASLMCYVCGCPGGAEGPGQNKTVGYSECSGQCLGEQVILIIGADIDIDMCG